MAKSNRRPQKPKVRNWAAKALSKPLFQSRTERDRTKYSRKVKHKLKSE